MARNPFWTDSLANATTFLISRENQAGIGFTPGNSDSYENEGSVSGFLSSFDTIDFVPVNLSAGASYTMAGTGPFQVDIEIFDSAGYLLISTDGDDIGIRDPYPSDSIVTFTPTSSGIHYVSVTFENGDFTGVWGLAVLEDIGGDFRNSNKTATPTAIPPSTTGTTATAFDVTSGTTADDSMFGASGADELWGANGNDTIDASDGSDIVYGNKGLDNIVGGEGNDTLFGGQNGGTPTGSPAAQRAGVDTVDGGSGDDVIYGNHGTDLLIGGSGDDTLFGGQDADTMSGGSGNDRLFGNLGDDVYTGGPGSDIFGVGKGVDRVNDFNFDEGDRLSSVAQRTSVRALDNDAVIGFEDGNTVTLVGVASNSVNDSFFV